MRPFPMLGHPLTTDEERRDVMPAHESCREHFQRRRR